MGGNEKVQKYIMALMQRDGLKSDALAKMAGISGPTVRSFLSDRRPISMRGADKLLGVFGLEIKIGKKQE